MVKNIEAVFFLIYMVNFIAHLWTGSNIGSLGLPFMSSPLDTCQCCRLYTLSFFANKNVDTRLWYGV